MTRFCVQLTKLQYQVCPKSGAVDWPPLLCPQCSKRADLLTSIKSKAYGQASEVCVTCFSDFSYLNMQQNLNFLYIKKCIMLNLTLSQKMCVSQASKSRRHRQVEVDFTSNEAGPSHSSGCSRINKLSLKARTNMNINISGKSFLQLFFNSLIFGLYICHLMIWVMITLTVICRKN